MSADNWAECPRCRRRGFKELRDRQKAAENAYGSVPEAEYLKLKELAKQPVTFPGESLREDYEIYIDNEKHMFNVYYTASCDVCGFSFRHEHHQQIDPGL